MLFRSRCEHCGLVDEPEDPGSKFKCANCGAMICEIARLASRSLKEHHFERSEVEEAAVVYRTNCSAFNNPTKTEIPETVKTEIAPTTNVSAMTIYMDDARSVEAIDLVSPSERKKFHWVPKTARGAEGGETAKTQDTAKTQNVADDAENSPVASPEFGSAELDVSRIVENLKRELDFIPADSLERHTAIMKIGRAHV